MGFREEGQQMRENCDFILFHSIIEKKGHKTDLDFRYDFRYEYVTQEENRNLLVLHE